MAWCNSKRFSLDSDSTSTNIFKRLNVRKNGLLILIVLGAFLGFIIGTVANGPVNRIINPEERRTTLMLIGFPGELFMDMLQMTIIPLVMCSLIYALADLDRKSTGKIGRRVIAYYLTTTVIAAIIGLILVCSIRPGRIGKGPVGAAKPSRQRLLDSFLDLVRNCFPNNIIEATMKQRKTRYSSVPAKYESYNQTINVTPINETITIINNGTHNITTITRLIYPASDTVPVGVMINPLGGMNILGLIVFSLLFGALLGSLEEKGKVLKEVFGAVNEVIMKMLQVFMWFAPIGICSLVASKIAMLQDPFDAVSMLGLYVVSVTTGLLIHGLLVLPALYFAFTRKNPYKFMAGMRDAIFTAFSITSSIATLPTTIRCAEENNKVDRRISRFILPLGASMNMDGVAINFTNSAVFVAQLHNIPTTLVFLVTSTLIATAVSVGVAGIPAGGTVFTVIVLRAVNLPIEDAGLIVSVLWILDRIITPLNIWGDSIGAGIIDHMLRDDIRALNELDEEHSSQLFTDAKPADENKGILLKRSLEQSASQV